MLHLWAWLEKRTNRADLFYWRTGIGEVVDFVVDARGRLLPVEVKSKEGLRLRDAAGLRTS